jgi:hypothetical protein
MAGGHLPQWSVSGLSVRAFGEQWKATTINHITKREVKPFATRPKTGCYRAATTVAGGWRSRRA